MADASLAGQLWCAFPGTYQGRKLKMRRESVEPGQVRPSAGAYEMKQRPDFTQPIAQVSAQRLPISLLQFACCSESALLVLQSCVETATGVAERWVPVRTQMESAGDKNPADFNPKGSMINDRRLMDHHGGYTGLMDQVEVTQVPCACYAMYPAAYPQLLAVCMLCNVPCYIPSVTQVVGCVLAT